MSQYALDKFRICVNAPESRDTDIPPCLVLVQIRSSEGAN
uniref:Uncharacterized protein n=1 Tax=Arundo donax TaxID=35708 RepID=A0A0A8ZW20_ARUDO